MKQRRWSLRQHIKCMSISIASSNINGAYMDRIKVFPYPQKISSNIYRYYLRISYRAFSNSENILLHEILWELYSELMFYDGDVKHVIHELYYYYLIIIMSVRIYLIESFFLKTESFFLSLIDHPICPNKLKLSQNI